MRLAINKHSAMNFLGILFLPFRQSRLLFFTPQTNKLWGFGYELIGSSIISFIHMLVFPPWLSMMKETVLVLSVYYYHFLLPGGQKCVYKEV